MRVGSSLCFSVSQWCYLLAIKPTASTHIFRYHDPATMVFKKNEDRSQVKIYKKGFPFVVSALLEATTYDLQLQGKVFHLGHLVEKQSSIIHVNPLTPCTGRQRLKKKKRESNQCPSCIAIWFILPSISV